MPDRRGDPVAGAEPARGSAGSRTAVVAVYAALVFFTAAESAMRIIVAPYLSEERGLGSGTIGVVVAAFAAAALVTRLPAGARFAAARVRALVLTGATLSASGYLILAQVSHPVAAAAALAVGGVGWSISTTTLLAALVVSKPRGRLGTASAMGWYAGFTGLGHTIAGVLGGYLADTFGFRNAFFTLAAGPLLGAVAITLAIRNAADRDPDPQRAPVDKPRLSWGAVRILPTAVWGGALVMVFINIIQSITSTFQPLVVLAAGLTLTHVGVISSVRSFAGATVRLASGAVFSRVPASGLTAPLMLLAVFAVTLIPTFASSLAWQVVLFAVIGVARGLLRVSGASDAFDAVEGTDEATGIAAAVVQGGLDVGKIVGPVAAGTVAEVFGLAAMFRILPIALFALYFGLRAVGAARRDRRVVSRPGAPR